MTTRRRSIDAPPSSPAPATTDAPHAAAAEPVPAFRRITDNPNQHTSRGLTQLRDAMARHGYVAPMTAAADGAILDGNARLETVATAFPHVDPIIVRHDGTRPVIAIRTDIPSAEDPRARDIIVGANRIAEVDLCYDLDVLRAFAADGLDLAPYAFDPALLEPVSTAAAAGDGGEAPMPSDRFGVIVLCESESEQRATYDRLVADGFRVKVVVV